MAYFYESLFGGLEGKETVTNVRVVLKVITHYSHSNPAIGGEASKRNLALS